MIKNWAEKYTNFKVRFEELPKNSSWKEFFNQPEVIEQIEKLNRSFSKVLQNNNISIFSLSR